MTGNGHHDDRPPRVTRTATAIAIMLVVTVILGRALLWLINWWTLEPLRSPATAWLFAVAVSFGVSGVLLFATTRILRGQVAREGERTLYLGIEYRELQSHRWSVVRMSARMRWWQWTIVLAIASTLSWVIAGLLALCVELPYVARSAAAPDWAVAVAKAEGTQVGPFITGRRKRVTVVYGDSHAFRRSPSFHVVTMSAGWPMPAFESRTAYYMDSGNATTRVAFGGLVQRGIPASWTRDVTGRFPRSVPCLPLFPGMAVNTAIYFVLIVVAVVMVRAIIGNDRIDRGRCPRCAYELAGAFGYGCPECGWCKAKPEDAMASNAGPA